jgi:hypothetical protein
MRKLFAAGLVAVATLMVGQAVAADMPYYPPVIDVPDVDYGVQGSFYLRGSAAINVHWAKQVNDACGACSWTTDSMGYGYSVGSGFGYETGTGLRVDATLDWLQNSGLGITKTGLGVPFDGKYSLNLRTALALANVYYDFSLSGDYSADGGMFAYVGAGLGLASNWTSVTAPAGNPIPDGQNTTFAAAGMVGVGYDFGSVVADVGYRGIYIDQINNTAQAPLASAYFINGNWIHEVRGTVRYRFN